MSINQWLLEHVHVERYSIKDLESWEGEGEGEERSLCY